MSRSLSLARALALAAPVLILSSPLHATDRVLPMHFELRTQGPTETCGMNCKLFIGASGAITADTPRNFLVFAQNRDLTGATVVIDSEEIRRLEHVTLTAGMPAEVLILAGERTMLSYLMQPLRDSLRRAFRDH